MAISTNINFPTQLPNALRAEHSMKPVQTFSRTEMEAGRARNRRRFTSVPTIMTVSWHFNDQQAQIFEAWFRDQTNDGTDWFNFQYRTPLGLQTLICRFATMYEGPTLAEGQTVTGRNHWLYSARLEAYERPMLPPGWGEFPDWVAMSDIFDIAMNREWPEA